MPFKALWGECVPASGCILNSSVAACLFWSPSTVPGYTSLTSTTTALGTDKASYSTGCHFDMAQIHFQRQAILQDVV